MPEAATRRSERTDATLTADHLMRLGELADVQHAAYTRGEDRGGNLSAWASRRVAVVLAQGAARHYLHPSAGHGVKDLDVWTFYAMRPGVLLRSGRYETHADFGVSELGRNHYPPPLVRQQRTWRDYQGRRIDFLVRELPVRVDAGVDEVISALRDWLEAGARQPCRDETGKNSSAHHLAHKAMVWICPLGGRAKVGERVWDVEVDGLRWANLARNPHAR